MKMGTGEVSRASLFLGRRARFLARSHVECRAGHRSGALLPLYTRIYELRKKI